MDVLKFLRSLSFGGLLGLSLSAILYASFPQLFAPIADLQTFALLGGCLGAGCQRLIEAAMQQIFYPLAAFISFYEKLLELHYLFNRGLISAEQYARLRDQLTERRFLGQDTSKLLPPKE